MNTDANAVEEYQESMRRVDFVATDHVDIFHAQVPGQLNDGAFIVVSGDRRQQSKILDKTALLAFWSIRWAQHTPLRGLQGTRTTDLCTIEG